MGWPNQQKRNDSPTPVTLAHFNSFWGFHKIGFSVLLSAAAAIIIASSFAWPTTTGWTRPSLSVSVANLDGEVHGSDSGSFDQEGRFIPVRFDAVFTRAAGSTAPGAASALTWRQVRVIGWGWVGLPACAHNLPLTTHTLPPQVRTLLAADRVARDPFGWMAAFLEWGALFYVAAQQFSDHGPWLLTRERARAAMDGTLWPVLEREAAAPRAVEKQQKKVGGSAARLVRRHEE